MYELKLKDIRNDYKNGLLDLSGVVDLYKKWLNSHHYMILYKVNKDKYLGYNKRIGRDTYDVNYLAVELSKRGNRVYLKRVLKKFRGLNECLYLSGDKRFLNGKRDKTNLLFITLTYDVKRCGVDEAWYCLGQDLNGFLDRLRKKYGRITVLRSFESYKNNYPHVHIIVGLKEKELPVLRYINKRGKERYRLTNRYKNEIESYHHSYVKVEGVKSVNAIKYVQKYIVKDQREIDDYKTISMCWFYGKRSYGMSNDFEGFISLKIELCFALLDTNMHNSEKDFVGYSFLCIVLAKKVHNEIFFVIEDELDFDIENKDVDFEDVFSEII